MGQLQWQSRNREGLCFIWHHSYPWQLWSGFLDSQGREREVFLLPPASPHLICYTQLPWCMDGTEDAIACVGTTGLQGNCSLLLAHLQQASPTPCTTGSWATVLLALPLMTTLTALSIMASTASSLSLLSVRWNDIFQHWQVLGAVPVKLSWDNVLEAGGWEVPQEGQYSAHPCVWGQLQAYLHRTDICAFEWTYLRCLKGFWNFSKQPQKFSINDWYKSVLM